MPDDSPDTPAAPKTQGRAGRPRRTDWQEPFLENYALHGIQAQTCRVVRVDPSTVKEERDRNPEFARRYLEAFEESTSALELNAFTWARGGLVLKKTRTVTRTIPGKNGEPDVTETRTDAEETLERSPAMTIFMLKSRRPAVYRERIHVENSGSLDLNVTGEEADAAVAAFQSGVVRLADARRARDDAARSGTG